MFRTLVVLGLLGGVGYVVVKWARGGPDEFGDLKTSGSRTDRPAPRGERTGNGNAATGGANGRSSPSVSAAVAGPLRVIPIPKTSAAPEEPFEVGGVQVTIVDSQYVSTQRPGQLEFLGKQVSAEALKAIPANEQERLIRQGKLIRAAMPFLAVEVRSADERPSARRFRVEGEQSVWRRWVDEDPLDPKRVRVLSESKTFERLEEGAVVERDELLGLVDTRLPKTDLGIKIAKLKASEAAYTTAGKTKDEALKRYQSLEVADRRAKGSVSPEELRGARLTYDRYVEDEKAKFQEISVAEQELRQSQVLIQLHEIRAAIPGVVKTIYKKHGEAVKEQEQILQIQNPDLLKFEGVVEVQNARNLRPGMKVVIEPVQPDRPARVLSGHREPVNAVAVSKGTQPYIVSASEDRTVRVWGIDIKPADASGKKTWSGQVLYILEHPAPVRTVACTPKGAAKNLCLSGTADGVGRLWDLDNLKADAEPTELKESHRGPINAAAFSADGKVCATGGDDNRICLWDTSSGSLLHRIDGEHKGAVTSLSFLADGRLVSAGKDRAMMVWSVKGGAEPERLKRIEPLGNQVEVLGAHLPAGDKGEALGLIDQGRQLRVLSLDDKTTRGIIASTSGTANFTTFALFSPDGRTVLTAGSSDNRLQLWRNPVFSSRGRAAELRQYIWTEAATTCAAFAPEAPFAVTGTKNYQVVVWALPVDLKEPENNATITYVDKFLETSSRQVRILGVVDTKPPDLMPGSTATMVVYPK